MCYGLDSQRIQSPSAKQGGVQGTLIYVDISKSFAFWNIKPETCGLKGNPRILSTESHIKQPKDCVRD